MSDYYRKVYQNWYKRFSYIYDLFINTFCFFFNGGFGGQRRWRELIVEWIDPQPREKIVDICCGTGTLTIMIAKRLRGVGKVIGLELSPAQLRVARKKEKQEGLYFLEADAQNIPFSDGYFDKGVICGALHEMPQEERNNVLLEAYRAVKPGGKIVIVEHNNPDKRWKASVFDFIERFNPEYSTYKNMLDSGLKNEISRAGFKIIKKDVISWDFFQIVSAEK